MKLGNNIKKVKESLESVRIKLFITLSITVVLIILFLIIVNNFVLETYYLYNKQKSLKSVYEQINTLYVNQVAEYNIESELEKISITQNFDISIMNSNFEYIYSSGKDYFSSMDGNKPMNKINMDYGEII